MFVTQHSGVWDRDSARPVVGLYEAAYEPMAEAAVTRELLLRTEFDEVLRDSTFRIWLLWEGEDPVAMCVIATDITRSRYLSTPTSRRTIPTHVRNGTVHYIYWLVVHPVTRPVARSSGSPRNASAVEAEDGALLVFDTPETNERSAKGGFAQMMERLAKMVGAPAPVQLLEVQRYYAIDLSAARVQRDAPLYEFELTASVTVDDATARASSSTRPSSTTPSCR